MNNCFTYAFSQKTQAAIKRNYNWIKINIFIYKIINKQGESDIKEFINSKGNK